MGVVWHGGEGRRKDGGAAHRLTQGKRAPRSPSPQDTGFHRYDAETYAPAAQRASALSEEAISSMEV